MLKFNVYFLADIFQKFILYSCSTPKSLLNCTYEAEKNNTVEILVRGLLYISENNVKSVSF